MSTYTENANVATETKHSNGIVVLRDLTDNTQLGTAEIGNDGIWRTDLLLLKQHHLHKIVAETSGTSSETWEVTREPPKPFTEDFSGVPVQDFPIAQSVNLGHFSVYNVANCFTIPNSVRPTKNSSSGNRCLTVSGKLIITLNDKDAVSFGFKTNVDYQAQNKFTFYNEKNEWIATLTPNPKGPELSWEARVAHIAKIEIETFLTPSSPGNPGVIDYIELDDITVGYE